MVKKLFRPVPALALLCLLLTGCVYNVSDTVVHDDCSGKVTFVDALLLEKDAEVSEGNKIYEANGNKYSGTETEYAFSSAAEFNKLFSANVDDEDAADAVILANSIPFRLEKAGDGTLTLTAVLTAEEAADTDASSAAGEDADDTEALTPEEQAALQASLSESAYILYTFTFDRPVCQLSGAADGVTIQGGKLTIDMLKANSGTDLVFTTAAVQNTPPLTPAPTTAPAPAAAPQVVLSPQKLEVNGKKAGETTEIYNIDGTNYFKIRDLAALLDGTGSQFNVDFDAARNTVTVKTGAAYSTRNGGELKSAGDQSSTAVPSPQSLEIDGAKVELKAYNIGGTNFFGLRALQPYLNYEVDYDAATNTAVVNAK